MFSLLINTNYEGVQLKAFTNTLMFTKSNRLILIKKIWMGVLDFIFTCDLCNNKKDLGELLLLASANSHSRYYLNCFLLVLAKKILITMLDKLIKMTHSFSFALRRCANVNFVKVSCSGVMKIYTKKIRSCF